MNGFPKIDSGLNSTSNNEPETKLIIDTDPGIDDIMALLLALAAPKVQILAITLTHGNTSLENVSRNLCSLFHTLSLHHQHCVSNNNQTEDNFFKKEWEVPRVAIGSEQPLKGQTFEAEDVHGNDGLGNLTNTHPHFIDDNWQTTLSRQILNQEVVKEENSADGARFKVSDLDGVEEILFQLRTNPPFTVSIVTLGPLTNLAKAYQRDPITVSRVKGIFTMGGAIKLPGNVTPLAEFNFYADALAASIIVDATKNYQLGQNKGLPTNHNNVPIVDQVLPLPLTLIPLDMTMSTYITGPTLNEFLVPKLEYPLVDFFISMLKVCIEWSKIHEKVDGVGLHDPSAMAVALNLIQPKIISENIVVDHLSPLTNGFCIHDRRFTPPKPLTPKDNCVQICYSIPKPEELQNTLLEVIFKDII